MNVTQFFEELFGQMIGDGTFAYVWSPSHGSTPFSDTQAMSEFVASHATGRDVYFGLGGTKTPPAKDKRPTNLQVSAIPGFWLDIDIADPAHKKTNLPQSREDALDLLSAHLPLVPTILVESGHGLHVYWLFKEPWMFETEDERIQAASLLRRFVLSLKYHAAMRGWTMDSVFDLARVLRAPGTMNCKIKGHELPCRVTTFNEGARYNPDEFEPYFVDEPEATSTDEISRLLSTEKNPLNLFLRPLASPDESKMATLMTIEPRFEQTWERRRSDLKDGSLSTYEMSIASTCVSYGWKDQEVADALIAFRRKHAGSPKEAAKGLRIDYITRTIIKARDGCKAHQAVGDALEIAKAARDSHRSKEPAPPPDKEKVRDALEDVLLVRIERIIRYTSEPATFEMVLTNGMVIPIGIIERLTNQRALKNIIAGACVVMPRTVKTTIWDEYCALMLELVETVETLREDSTEKGILAGTITQYLEKVGILDDKCGAVHTSRPFWEKGKAYIFSKAFVSWAKLNDEPITLREFATAARTIGITTRAMHFDVGTEDKPQRTTKSVYDVTAYVTRSCGTTASQPVTDTPSELEVYQ